MSDNMAVIVEEVKKDEPKEQGFPKLMAIPNGFEQQGLIVLFLRFGVGSVVRKSENWDVGEYSCNWRMEDFTDYNGTITIKNA